MRAKRVPLAILCLALSCPSLAAKDSLDEVAEVGESTPAPESVPARRWLEYRGYVVSELGWIPEPKYTSVDKATAIGELNLAASVSPREGTSMFVDLLGNATVPNAMGQAILAQGGVRTHLAESWSLALGKERNFRAPGMLVNPSDFIHPAQNVPGQRMQRSGVWLARASYQTRSLTMDALFLPFNDLDRYGLPSSLDAAEVGGAGRAFAVLGGGDLGVTAGYFDRAWQVGLSSATYLIKKLEAHAELGLRQADNPRALAGIRYDVGSSSSLTLEGYYNGRGYDSTGFAAYRTALLLSGAASSISSSMFSGSATSTFNIFNRQWYGILGYSTTELLNRFNLQASLVAGLEDVSALSLLRCDWLVSNQSTLGVFLIAMGGPSDGQYGLRPMDARLGFEWRVNF